MVEAGVGDDGRRLGPGQAVRLEVEAGQRGRRAGQRVEGAEQVVAEPGCGHLGGADGAAGLGLCLEHEHVPAGVGEDVGGDETVRPGADDHGVDDVGAHARVAAAPRAIERARPAATSSRRSSTLAFRQRVDRRRPAATRSAPGRRRSASRSWRRACRRPRESSRNSTSALPNGRRCTSRRSRRGRSSSTTSEWSRIDDRAEPQRVVEAGARRGPGRVEPADAAAADDDAVVGAGVRQHGGDRLHRRRRGCGSTLAALRARHRPPSARTTRSRTLVGTTRAATAKGTAAVGVR